MQFYKIRFLTNEESPNAVIETNHQIFSCQNIPLYSNQFLGRNLIINNTDRYLHMNTLINSVLIDLHKQGMHILFLTFESILHHTNQSSEHLENGVHQCSVLDLTRIQAEMKKQILSCAMLYMYLTLLLL